MTKLFRKEEGFTLVELMVVVLIIGILVAIAVPVFNMVRASSEKRTCQSNLRTIDGAIEQWIAENPAREYNTLASTSGITSDLAGYFKEIPKCPTEKVDYNIVATTAEAHAECASAIKHTYPD